MRYTVSSQPLFSTRHRERSVAIHVSYIKDTEVINMDCRVASAPRNDVNDNNEVIL